MNVRKFLVVAILATFTGGAWCADLTGSTNVNVTSDTAAEAKNKAFNQARRQIIVDALASYTAVDALRAAVADESSAVLTNLIALSSIDGEKFSDTTYSANITMTVDADAARVWLTDKGVQNWLPVDGKGDAFVAVINLRNRVADWANLLQIARNDKINVDTKVIAGNQVTIQVPEVNRTNFTIALRESGWKTENHDGVLHVSR